MIDIHCHILPGFDDGPNDEAGALAMLTKAQADGVTTIVATPHIMKGSYDHTRAEIVTATAALQTVATDAGIGITLVPGGEVYIDFDILEQIKTGAAPVLGDSRYLLLEFPAAGRPRGMDEIIFEIQIRGFFPVLAHPERNLEVLNDPSVLYEYAYKGVLVQQNTGSLLGRFGKTVQQAARTFLEHNLVHLVGSDAHDSRGRTFEFGAWRAAAAPLIGEDNVAALTSTVPAAVLRGEEIDFNEPRQILPGNWLTRVQEWWTKKK